MAKRFRPRGRFLRQNGPPGGGISKKRNGPALEARVEGIHDPGAQDIWPVERWPFVVWGVAPRSKATGPRARGLEKEAMCRKVGGLEKQGLLGRMTRGP